MWPRVLVTVLLFWLAGELCLTQSLESHLYYVRPSEEKATACPDSTPCFPLQHYLKNASLYFTDNTTLSFLNGMHKLDTSLIIQNVANLSLIGGPGATVVCTGAHEIHFMNTRSLAIEQIVFINCGSGKKSPWKPWARFNNMLHCDASAALCIASSQNINISRVTVANSTGYGLLAVNILGSSTIEESSFVFNNYHALKSGYHNNTSPQGGNVFILYTGGGCIDTEDTSSSQLHIASCTFSHGMDLSKQPQNQFGSGLTVIAASVKHSTNIYVQNVLSEANTAHRGANMYFAITTDNSNINLVNSISRLGNVDLPPAMSLDDPLPVGAGLYYHYRAGGFQPRSKTGSILANSGFAISQCTFIDNHGPSSSLHFDLLTQQPHHRLSYITLSGIMITRSAGLLSISMPRTRLPECTPNPSKTPITILIQNSTFLHSIPYNTHAETPHNRTLSSFDSRPSSAAVDLKFLTQASVTIANCIFTDNTGTALSILDSNIKFQGEVLFAGNMGVHGGAMALCGDSIMSLLPSTHIRFHSNHAVRGGAIYVEETVRDSVSQMCFFQLEEPINNTGHWYNADVAVFCENNTAMEAGDAVYGGHVESCPVFDAIFHIEGKTEILSNADVVGTSAMTLDPERVCPCMTDKPDCSLGWEEVQAHPGDTFQLLVALVGQTGGAVAGTVRGEFSPCPGGGDGLDTTTTILQSEAKQTVRECTVLTYTLLSGHECAELTLKPETSNELFSHSTAKITIRIIPCPLGFQLSEGAYCKCNALLQRYKVECIIDTKTFVHESPLWVGTESGTVAVSENCYGDYCCPGKVDLPLGHDDVQCVMGRTGVLCGACEPGFSLTLGGNRCRECSNTYLFLLMVFVLVGIVGVALLAALNLTVSTGTINGLLLYANIVQANYITFFPPHSDIPLPRLKQFLTVLLSWPNLDIGIETCFYNGMTAATKAWLQLVFPVYFSTLGGLFYLVCQCTALRKHLSKLSASVFATTLLLSLAKILRTITTYFAYAVLHYQDEEPKWVWLYDGNLDYFHGKHATLFITAVLILTILILPYAVLLLLTPCLQAMTEHCCLMCGEHSKHASVLGAYLVPFRKTPRVSGCWVGIALLLRIAVLVASVITPENSLLIIVTATVILLVLAWQLGQVYKSVFVRLTEALFILNLGLLATWSLQDSTADPSTSKQYVITYVLVGTAIATAVVVLVCPRAIQLARWLKGSNIIETPLTDAQSPHQEEHRPLVTVETSTESEYMEMSPLRVGALTVSTKSRDQ